MQLKENSKIYCNSCSKPHKHANHICPLCKLDDFVNITITNLLNNDKYTYIKKKLGTRP